jgi:centromere protein I
LGVNSSQDLLPSVRSFLRSYLETWNGEDNREQILRLLRYLPIESLETLRSELLSPLESAMMKGSSNPQTTLLDLLDFYTSFVREWGVKLRSQPSVFEESSSLSEVIKHAELLASSVQEFAAVTMEDQDKARPKVLSLLEFYSSLAELFSHASQNAKIRLTVPLAPTVYTIAFTPSIATISILNSILAGYKSSFEASLTSEVIKPPNPPEPLYNTAVVSQFNGYVMDMCNLVWRNRALNAEDPNALGCLIPQASVAAFTEYVRNVNEANRHYDRESAFNSNLPSTFSLSHHAAYCNLSAACFADLEESQQIPRDGPNLRKPVTQKALQALEKDGGAKITWQEYRVHMLDWLEAIGSRGTSDLMRSTMKALRRE